MFDIMKIVKAIFFILSLGLAFVIVIVVMLDGKKVKTLEKINSLKQTNTKNNSKNKKTIKKDKGNQPDPCIFTQDILEFDRIEEFSPDNPIGVIVKKNTRDFIGIIEVEGINFNLLDYEERLMLEKNFQVLLNGIDFPIQLYIQSKKLSMEGYLKQYSDRLGDIEKSLKNILEKIELLKQKQADEKEVKELEDKAIRLNNQYSYGITLIEYISGRCNNQDMLERKYYIAIKYTFNPSQYREDLTSKEMLINAFSDIENKATGLISALIRANLNGRLLTGIEIADLLYSSYNKVDSENYKLKNAVKSRFSHLFSTSEAIEIRELKDKLDKIQSEKANLNEKIRQTQDDFIDLDYDDFEEVNDTEEVGA